ncbi:MAG: hypothetical protein LBS18_06665 [Clostridiales bacterium]|jgi:hypothetical protein|nr:hypothetical protein [Clostridiales bacterium]
MVVYICADRDETRDYKMREYCEEEINSGNIPFAPQLLFVEQEPGDAEDDEELWMSLEMLARLDALHVYGTNITPSMKREIAYAASIRMPVAYMDDDDDEEEERDYA